MREKDSQDKVELLSGIGDNKKEKSQKRNGLLSLIACFIYSIGSNVNFILLDFTVYIISYLKKYDPKNNESLTLQYIYFISSISTVTLGLFVSFSGFLEFKLGIKNILLFGALIQIIGCFIIYFTNNFYIYLVSFFIMSLGISMNVKVPIKNALMYFPKKEGVICGIYSLFGLLISSILSFIGEKVIINPKSIDPDDDYYYPYEISKNVFKFILVQIIIISICTLLTIILIAPFNQKNEKNNEEINEKNVKLENRNSNDSMNLINNSCENNESLEIEKNKSNDDKKVKNEKYGSANLKKLFKSFRVWRFFIMSICSCPLHTLMSMTWRPIGMLYKIPTNYLQYIISYSFILNAIATPLFGFLADKISFRLLQVPISIICSIIGFLFCIYLNNNILFITLVLGFMFFSGANMIIPGPHCMKVFGMKYYIEISGVIGLASVILSPVCSIFSYFIENYIEDRALAYKIIFVSISAVNLIQAILAIFETEDVFIY